MTKTNVIKTHLIFLIFFSIFLSRYVLPFALFEENISGLNQFQKNSHLDGFYFGILGAGCLLLGWYAAAKLIRVNQNALTYPTTAHNHHFNSATLSGFLSILFGIGIKFYHLSSENFKYEYSDPCGDFFFLKFFLAPNFPMIIGAIFLLWAIADKSRDNQKIPIYLNLTIIVFIYLMAIISPDTGRNPLIAIAIAAIVLLIYKSVNIFFIAVIGSIMLASIPVKNIFKDIEHINTYYEGNISFVTDCEGIEINRYEKDLIGLVLLHAGGACDVEVDKTETQTNEGQRLWYKWLVTTSKSLAENACRASLSDQTYYERFKKQKFSSTNDHEYRRGTLGLLIDTTLGRLNQIHIIDYYIKNRDELKKQIIFSVEGLLQGVWKLNDGFDLNQKLSISKDVGLGPNVLSELYLISGVGITLCILTAMGFLFSVFERSASPKLKLLFTMTLLWPLIHHFEQSIPAFLHIMVKYSGYCFLVFVIYNLSLWSHRKVERKSNIN